MGYKILNKNSYVYSIACTILHVGGIHQTTDGQIVSRIQELVSEGVTGVQEMRRHLKEYVQANMFPGRELPPTTSRRYFPTKKDIHNHMYRAITKNRFSNCDQTNAAAKVATWKQQNPKDNFFFRPYGEVVDNCGDGKENESVDDGDEDDEMEVKVTSLLTRQKLLFVHQSPWQRRLLARYGNTICLLDATYKTTRYALPLFFLAVKTNVDYQVVASFIIQDESTDSIKEALTVLCDFHREQAWERWVAKKDHGVSTQKDLVLCLIRRVAHASTEAQFGMALASCKSSEVWKENKKFRGWFENKWLKHHKRWVWAFRNDGFQVMVNTNNGVERQNKLFKYSYLRSHRISSLSAMMGILIEEFLPDNYDRYVQKNIKCSSSYRKYSNSIPQFLLNKPRHVVAHCMERWENASSIPSGDITIEDHENGCFKVQSQCGGKEYHVMFGDAQNMPKCECADWRRHYLPCKHFLAIFHHIPGWHWNRLAINYQESPLINLDEDLYQPHIPQGDADIETLDSPDNQDDKDPCTSPSNNIDRTLQLPKRKSSPRSEATKCRELLHQLRSLTFLVQDQAALNDLRSTLHLVLNKLQKAVPVEDGIPLEQTAERNRCEKKQDKPQGCHRTKKEEQEIIPLPHRKTKRSKFSGRVGQFASVMRQTHNVSTPVEVLAEQTATHSCTNGIIDDDVEFVKETKCSPAKRKKRDTQLPADEIRLIKNNEMLTDISMNVAQNTLKAQAPHLEGLQDTVLGQSLSFSIATAEFVQVLHDGGAHWVCTSNIGCSNGCVNYFDSLFHGQVKEFVQKQFAKYSPWLWF